MLERLRRQGYASIGRRDTPPVCPHCGLDPADWTTIAPPLKPWELTYNDKRFLRSLGIEWREDGSGP